MGFFGDVRFPAKTFVDLWWNNCVCNWAGEKRKAAQPVLSTRLLRSRPLIRLQSVTGVHSLISWRVSFSFCAAASFDVAGRPITVLFRAIPGVFVIEGRLHK